jgi:MFS superfamily sulfate permease-like transporter
MVVGALIFVLGIDLVKEALWDNRNRVTWSVASAYISSVHNTEPATFFRIGRNISL